MIDCLVLGDSIAVGTHQFRPDCAVYARGGWNTWQWNRDYLKNDLSAKTVIISLGTNDHKGVKTREELERMRARVTGSRVFWIMPPCNDQFCKPWVNQIVEEIAKEHGDMIVATNRVQPDHIHPSWAGYKEIAEKTR